MTVLNQNIKDVVRTTSKHISALNEMGLYTVKDLLYYFPRRYEDQSESKVLEVTPGKKHILKGIISNINSKRTRSGVSVLSMILTDNTGSIELVFFNQPYLKNTLKPNMEIKASGIVKFDYGKLSMQSPHVEEVGKDTVHSSKIIPIYSEKEVQGARGKISSKWLREKIYPLLYMADYISDPLAVSIKERQELMKLSDAIKEIHFPSNHKKLDKAKERISFDELLGLQVAAVQKKWLWRNNAEGTPIITIDQKLDDEFRSSLPFELTGAQKRTLKEIYEDLERGYPMLRLLQGDVGSGKTVVAALSALQVAKKGFQVAVMAPTSILATQHEESFKKMLKPFGIKVGLLLGSMNQKDKTEMTEKITAGEVDVIIGTHALIQETVSFKKLGLAIVDEQHRFGVKQRQTLKSHGNPHLLNMSATPIPRTLALTIYGDQDVAVIDEMPAGRQEIITRIVPEQKRMDAYRWIKDQVADGRQVYVICPLVEESEKLENVRAAKEEFDRLSEHIFPNLSLGLLHGRMSSQDKEEVMNLFAENKIQILVSTSVVEVGINVPNATIIMIEGAERFGLSQLHQFRGRVGRGSHQSYCFLFPNKLNDETKKRLLAMVNHSSGFELSEIDLELRGPGEVYGVRQSGIPDLRVASFTDTRTIKKARSEAEIIIESDPYLELHPELKIAVDKQNSQSN